MRAPPQTLTLPRTLALPDEAATARLAACMAPLLGAGDVLLLSGQIGAGKTTFARALIRSLTGHPAEDVPSPSFTLVQAYDTPGLTVWHVDLYRLTGPEGAMELGLDEAMDSALCLIEWPDRLGSMTPAGALTLEFLAGTTSHHVTISGINWAGRLEACLDPA